LRIASPQACVVNPDQELQKIDTAKLRTKSGHYSAIGNAALASAIKRGMAACGMSV
jgi:hypothetical protein